MRGFERYRILRLIKEGGAAEVFEAAVGGELGFSRRVAIKRLKRGVQADASFVKGFIDEAHIASRLHHANIVGIFDFGVSDGLPFQVLEYVDGCDLLELESALKLRGGSLAEVIAISISLDVARALEAAHGAIDESGRPMRIVHRDVSPENVLVSWNGDVKLADFGIARATRRLESTAAGVAKGKMLYMAPEQLRGDDVDARADIFSLGCLLHRLLTGASPIEVDAVRMFVWAGGVVPIDPSIAPDLAALIARATKSAREERLSSATAFAAECARLLAARRPVDTRASLAAVLADVRGSIVRTDFDVPAISELVLESDVDFMRHFSSVMRVSGREVRESDIVNAVVDSAVIEREETTAVVPPRVSPRSTGEHVFEEPVFDSLLGTTLGTYRVEELIGEGATSRVYRAVHPVLGRSLTIKVLAAQGENPARTQRRFQREAQALARVRHPNVVEVVDFGTTPGGLTYLVMEHASGRTLDRAIEEEGPFAAEQVAAIARQLALGLAAIHAAGLIHRDLKPQNVILLSDGSVKILDFGIVRVAEDTDALTALTRGADFLGTPAYMAPEQMRTPGSVGPAADLWSLGAIMYAMLSGRPPFVGEVLAVVQRRLSRERPAALPNDGPLERLVFALLEDDPARRPAPASAVAERLAVPAPPVPVVMLAPPGARSRTTEVMIFAAVVTAGLVVSSAVAAIILRSTVPAPTPAVVPAPAEVDPRGEPARAEPVIEPSQAAPKPIEPEPIIIEEAPEKVRPTKEARRREPPTPSLRDELDAVLSRHGITAAEVAELEVLTALYAGAQSSKDQLAAFEARLDDADVERALLDRRLARIKPKIAGDEALEREYLDLRSARERGDRSADRRALLRKLRDLELRSSSR